MLFSKKEDPLPRRADAIVSKAPAISITAETQRFGFWIMTGMPLPVRLFRPVAPVRATR